ncbi:MAG: Gfo/Idh/MocA family oxidoreductase [Opitutaceae bacterium]|jgi:predicted dehydrogenase|nr:Gfo/Idh/MocA family oxidoreductase [Opitutaceae bacterium]
MAKKTILIIGCGSIGERHLRCFQSTQRCEVIACDTNERLLKSVSERYGVPPEPDFRGALVSRRPDAAVICTPAPFHLPIAIAALDAGCHVLIEKPLSTSLKDVAALLDAAARSGRQAAAAYVYRVYPVLRQARAFLAGDPLGAVRQIVVSGGQPFHLMRKGYQTTYYRDRAMGGGAVQDALTHWANSVEWLAGPTDSVMCDCAHLAVPGVEVEDTVHVSARNGGVLVSYALNQFQMPNDHIIQLNAERGSVRVEVNRQRWGVWRQDSQDWAWEDAPVSGPDAHFTAQANAFLDQMEGKAASLCTLQEAVHTLRFNLAALRSAETGARVLCHDLAM